MSGSASPTSSLSSSSDSFSPIHSREWDPQALKPSGAGAGDGTSTIEPASEGSSYSWLPSPLKRAVDYGISISPWGEPTWLHPFEELNTTELMPKDRLLQLKALIEEIQKLWFPCSVPEDRVLAVINRLLANLPQPLLPEAPVTTATGTESVQLAASTSFVVIEDGAGDSPREATIDSLRESGFTRVDIDIRGNSREILASIEEKLLEVFSYKLEQAANKVDKNDEFLSRCNFLEQQRKDLQKNLKRYKQYETEESLKGVLITAFVALFYEDEQKKFPPAFREDPINTAINTFIALGTS